MRPLGRTGLMVSRLGLGMAALGRPGYINLSHGEDLRHNYDADAMKAHAYQVLDVAWANGIRYFDVARSYGRAEEFLAGWLSSRAIEPDQVVVGSKWGYIYTADWRIDAEKHEVKDHSRSVFERQLAESRAWLGSHLDLYQIHSATLESGVLDNAEVLDALRRLKSQGVRVGLSLSGPRQAATLSRALELSVFDCVQATWNLLEPSVGPALAEAHAAGLGVIVKEALANGRLTERNTEPESAEKIRRLRQIAERSGVGVDAVALAAVLRQPWADVVLSGAATPMQLVSNVKALPIEVPVAWDEFAEPAELYWAKRSALPWN
jgi:aryl-alcohol dehydrogenase-like predicted oxidoreductase